MAAMDERFDGLFAEMHALRDEMRAGFAQLRGEIAAVRTEISAVRTELTSELIGFHRQVMLILAGPVIALIGLLGAVVAQV
jgi:hypothetical protein